MQAIDWLRLPLFQGFATSAVAGAEGLVRSSRSALVKSINKYQAEQRQDIVTSIIKDLMVALSDNLQDDRYAIPVLEFLAFLLDSYISSIHQPSESRLVPLYPPNLDNSSQYIAIGNCLFLFRRHISNRLT